MQLILFGYAILARIAIRYLMHLILLFWNLKL